MSVRLFVALALLLAGLLGLFLVLVATETALSVWQRLAAAPWWLQLAYVLLLAAGAAATSLLAWRWLRPRARRRRERQHQSPLTEDALRDDLLQSASAGVDVADALEELREQRRRREAGEVHIALFGEVSTGKSTLVRAMLPEAETDTDPRAGTTREVQHYRWRSEHQDTVVIADLPGFNLDDDPAILEEARRAHLVLFLCDGDLTSSQHAMLDRLLLLGKPLIVALNKLDRYAPEEREAIIRRLSERAALEPRDIVPIQAGGREEVVRLLTDGTEQRESRNRETDIDALLDAVQRHLDENHELMESLRDTSVLLLASEKLERARNRHREAQAEALVARYSKRAVVGALAAVAPGSDLVIQGALATRLIQELCALYDVSVKDVQVESFLRLAGGKLRKMSALTLAITGNALKAFPGLGTLSGGLLHAVAYGLIFDSLGRAAAATLASRGALRPYPAAEAFEDLLSENLASNAERFARLAVTRDRDTDAS